MNRFSYLKFALVPLIAWSFYWGFYYELVILQKTFQDTFFTAYQNWILLTVLVVLEAIIIYKEGKLKAKTIVAETQAIETNPFTIPKKTGKTEKDSFVGFMRSSRDAYSEKIESAFDSVYRSRIHRRIFFKIKRIAFGCLCILYLALAFMSLANPAFFIVFLITAYAFLENLLLARHYQFIKRKVKENE